MALVESWMNVINASLLVGGWGGMYSTVSAAVATSVVRAVGLAVGVGQVADLVSFIVVHVHSYVTHGHRSLLSLQRFLLGMLRGVETVIGGCRIRR